MGGTVSIIVVAYGGGPQLRRCLEAVRGAGEVIVVDNGPEPGLLETGSLGHAIVVSAGRNLGFGGGCNLGARVATGETLVFLNPDTIAVPGAVRALADAVADPEVGIAMGRLRLYGEPDLLHSAGTAVHVSGLAWSQRFGERADSIRDVVDVPAPCGAAMAMRADLFAELGGFHDPYFLYLEDVELGWRVRMGGRRVVLVPDADVYHDYDFERNSGKRHLMERNRLAFLATCFTLRTLLVLLPLLLAAEVAMTLLALRQGWLRDKARGWWWFLRILPGTLRHRRSVQRARRVPDRELARSLTVRIDPSMIRLPRVVALLNPLVGAYWTLARRAL